MYLFQSWNIKLCSAFTNGNTWNVFFFAATVPFQFQSTVTFLKAIYDKFSGRGLLLGECQLHKIVSLPILQVQFDGDSSVLLGKFDLPNIWPETWADLCICWIKASFVGGKIELPYFCDTWRFHTEPNQSKKIRTIIAKRNDKSFHKINVPFSQWKAWTIA